MQIFDKDFKEIFSAGIISAVIGLVVGVVLVVYTDKLLLLPGMLIIIPGFLELRGNISGSFSSRLSSGLFLHIVNPRKYNTKIVKENILASFILAVAVSFALGIIAFLLTYLVFQTAFFQIIFIPILAGLLSNVIEIPLTLFTTLYLFRKGHDPNNIMGPFVTSTGDITSIVSLIVVAVMLV